MFVKHYAPWSVFVTDVLYNWISQFKISMKKKFIYEIVTYNGFGRFDPGDIDLWPSDPKMKRVPLLPRTDLWTPSLRRVGQGILELLIGNEKVTDGPTDWLVQAICPLFF